MVPAVIDEATQSQALRAAWILGSSRSGSTWLLRMLSELDGVVGVDETHLGHHLGLWRPISLAWATAEELPELTTYGSIKAQSTDYVFSKRYEAVWRPVVSELLETRLRAQLQEEHPHISGPLVVIKEPGGSEVAELLLSLLPGSRLIFLLRDGRDVVDSWLDAYRSGTWAADEGTYPLREDARIPFIRWQAAVWAYRTRSVEQAFNALPEDRRVFVRYEDLVERPMSELARLARALGLQASEADVETAVSRHRYWGVPRDTRGSGHRIRWAQPGRWRASMSSEEATAMGEIVDELLVRYGYERTAVPSSVEEP